MDIGELLELGVREGASDLHLSAGQPPIVRVDGVLRRLGLPPTAHGEVLALLAQSMGDRERQDYERCMEADYAYEAPGVARFRVNAFRHQRGASGVFRAIPARVPPLEELGMGEVFRDIASLPRGLVLVTGPTGSGKSTTLAAMLDHINHDTCQHILTLEDPIEFVHECQRCLVSQRQIHRDTRSFGEALRAALREDPDIILVGELRDLETMRLAMQAAETGHLVFATLHTQSAAKTIDRVIEVFPAGERNMARSMLSESLQAVVAQTLLRRPGGGRVAAREIMRATPAIRNLIREDRVAQIHSAIQTGRDSGMQTLDQCLEELLRKGLVSGEDARAKARVPGSF